MNNKTHQLHGTLIKLYFLFRCDIKFCSDFWLKALIRTFESVRQSLKVLSFLYMHIYTLNPIYTHKKIGTAFQIFGTVPVNFGHGTPNYRRVNVSVPKKVWHWCLHF